MTPAQRKRGAFTGRHFLMVMIAAFGLIIAVNLVMAVLATRSHPGMVVESSYVAGQQYNQGLAAGRQQQARGWQVAATVDGPMIRIRAHDAAGQPLSGATATLVLHHPLGRGDPLKLALAADGTGSFAGAHGLQPGQWEAEILIARGEDRHWMRQRLVVR